MKTFYLLPVLVFFLYSCSSDSEGNSGDDDNPGANLDFTGYVQTFLQTGDELVHSYEEDKWMQTTVEGDMMLDLQYDAEDNLVRIVETRNGNLIDLQYEYDSAGELSKILEYDVESESFQERSFNYSGNRLEVSKIDGGQVVFTFQDDRLLKFEDFSASGLVHSEEYAYDSRGNITENRVYSNISDIYEITEVFGYEYDDANNPLAPFFNTYQIPFLIYASKEKLYNYELTTAVRAFGPNNREVTIYPESYTENQKLEIENEYEGNDITFQTLIHRPSETVIQTLEFLYND